MSMKPSRSIHDCCESASCPAVICSFTVAAILTHHGSHIRTSLIRDFAGESLAMFLFFFRFVAARRRRGLLAGLVAGVVVQPRHLQQQRRVRELHIYPSRKRHELFLPSLIYTALNCERIPRKSFCFLTVKSSGEIQLSPSATPPRLSLRAPARMARARETPSVAAYLPP